MNDFVEKKITWIPLDKIFNSRWSNGIRDKEVYKQTKENIKTIGLCDNPRVFPLDDKFEVYIGDHRIRILKELHKEGHWGDKAPCFIDDIAPEKAWEKCVSDNICRQNYSCVELENIASKGWKTGRYKSHAELGKAIGGKSGQWIGRLLEARQIREVLKDKAKVTFNDVSTEVVLATRELKDINDRAQLLKLVQEKKVYAKDIKQVAELCRNDENMRKKILYEGILYHRVKSQFENGLEKVTNKKKVKTITIENTNFAEDLYKKTATYIDTYLLMLNGDDNKKTAINYIKMTIGKLAESLLHHKVINDEQFKQIKVDMLGVHRNNLKDYSGENLDIDVDKWL
jgi:ParB-like chromosome segregation protein Spo0J